ncbi:DUF1361 domain-containing protein [Georgenia satyanarayanai]|uniref:DUF1361 domain-containing protein n=1 Tax=Georgenia satyanarayanai TaxID=860221 RepID=UPI00126568B0|nr:DUF1361 domain-containing protein [Georgenia satyanarayanai]
MRRPLLQLLPPSGTAAARVTPLLAGCTVVAVVTTLVTAGGRGLPGVASRQRLEDNRHAAPSPAYGRVDAVNAVILLAAGVVLLNLYALALVVARAPAFGTRLYRPMVLNIGLSVAPAVVLAVTTALLLLAVVLESPLLVWPVIAGGGVTWLLVLPNSAYLITELNFSHRRQEEAVPLWYDIVLVLTLAVSGVMNTLLNVLLVQTMYLVVGYPNDAEPFTRVDSWVLSAVVLLLVTLGMYLGRYLRFNSWDVAHPRSFVRKLVGHFGQRAKRREALGFCVTHTVLLALLYLLVVGPAVATL